MKKRPARLLVVGKPITYKYVPAGHALLRDSPDDPRPGVGRADSDKQIVAIEDGMPLEQEQDSVLHETFHIIEDAMCIRISELAVRQLATGFLAVLKDNPELVDYLKRTT